MATTNKFYFIDCIVALNDLFFQRVAVFRVAVFRVAEEEYQVGSAAAAN